MAGISNPAFRVICKEFGAGLIYTEMVSDKALYYDNEKTVGMTDVEEQEHPLAMQIFGHDIETMVYAAKFLDEKTDCDIIDINMGCPVPNIFKSGEGSALLANPRRAAAVIRGCKKSGKPVTVKTRVGIRQDELIAAEFTKMCEEAGADMVSIHGRSRSMMYDGTPYYDQIEQAKSAVSIPVIANGGIFSDCEAQYMLDATGADGVMIGRYALQDPYIFSRLTGRSVTEDKYSLLLGQLELTSRHYDETYTLTYMKKLASYCMKKRSGTKKYKQLLYHCGNVEEMKQILKAIFYEEEADRR